MATIMSLSIVTSELKKFDKAELIQLITTLYKKNKSVKEHLDFFVNPNENELFRKYRDKISEAFFPKRGLFFKLTDTKKAIADFKKFEPSSDLLSQLIFFYVECAIKLMRSYGNMHENFYLAVAKMYLQTLILIDKNELSEKFKTQAYQIVIEAGDLGWGFPDTCRTFTPTTICDVKYDFLF